MGFFKVEISINLAFDAIKFSSPNRLHFYLLMPNHVHHWVHP